MREMQAEGNCTIFLLKSVRLTPSGRFVPVLHALKSGISLLEQCTLISGRNTGFRYLYW